LLILAPACDPFGEVTEGPSDQELLLAWRDGNEDAGNALVRRHFPVVFRFFRSKITEGVEDLAQRTFLGCVESADAYRGDASFRAFVLGIARKQLLLHFRTRYRREAVFDPATLSLQDVAPPSGGSPSALIAARDEERLLVAALRRLPVDFQIAVELFYWEELPIAEIAQVLEVATGTVKSRLGRARDMLRRHVADLASSSALAVATTDDLDRWAKSLRRRFDREE
jgi:RNA polymerase sigma factor (sigma-70 family)